MANDRLERAIGLLDSLDLDALLVTNGTNRRYLSGFTAEDHAPDELSATVVLSREGATLFSPSTNLPWAEAEALPGIDVRPAGHVWTETVVEWVKSCGWQRFGFEDATTTVAVYNDLRQSLGERTELVPVGNAVDRLRSTKDDSEIALLTEALHLTDRAFVAAVDQIQPGMTEKQAVEIIAAELRNAGSEGEAFPIIVASGPNAARPHHAPGSRAIQESEPIIIDMGALHQGYAGDLTRTIWFGQPSDQLGTMYQMVKAAHGAALSAAGPSVTGIELDAAARDVFAEHDLDEYFVHSLGHGLGLRVHEAPSASKRSEDVLVPGNVVTIEPGLYIPGWGGVRIEDVVLITSEGSLNLTEAPKRTV